LLIDCDVHCEPASWDALEPYLDSTWRQFVVNGKIPLGPNFFGDDSYPTAAPTTALPEVREAGGPFVPQSYDVLKGRLLDRTNPERAILTCASLFDSGRNPYLQAATASALNDWLRHEWLDRDARLRASIVVSPFNVEAAATEIARVAEDPRFVQVLLPIRGDALWGHRQFAPIHAAAAEHGLALALHAWGLNGHSPTPSGRTTTYVEDYLSNAAIVQHHVVNLVAEGVFVRYPDLKVAILECGFNWLPSLYWRMDKHWKRSGRRCRG
jgi:predicted TIM-barrel fold metal-dependent hydrolase